MCQFLRGTQSQVRVGSSLSAPWQDNEWDRSSDTPFNLLVDTLASDVRRLTPGAPLVVAAWRFTTGVVLTK